MTLLQEAYALMQEQPEKNIQLIVDLLQTMSFKKEPATKMPHDGFKRTGLAKGLVELPDSFDDTFDALDEEVREMFEGDSL